MACDYRVLDAKARIGLPEVTLGLIPGAGGTQRLPRLAGQDTALELAVSGKPIGADAALKSGIVDLVSHVDLLKDAIGMSHHGERQKRRVRDMPAPDLDRENVEAWQAFCAKRARGQLAPRLAIEAVIAAHELDFDAGLARERELFSELMSGSQSRAMRHLFFAERQAGKLVTPVSADAVELRSIGVIGAGTMGVGIATAMLAAGYHVRLFDTKPDNLHIGRDRILAILDGELRKGRISKQDRADRDKRLEIAPNWSAFADADLIIEAVFEDMDVKTAVFAELAAVARPDCILASNTSYLDINALADGVSHPERVLGLHFFSPAHIMKLLEIVRADRTSDAVLATALALAKRTRKIGVVSGVCHGFIGNRMLSGYGREAGLLLLEGASPRQIDQALFEFGMPMGPFAMGDMAGLDIGYSNRKKLSPDQFEARAFQVHDQLVEMGRKGQKTGRGFYRYDGGDRTPLDDPETAEIIDAVRTRLGVTPRAIDDAEIVDRCIYALVNEGARLLGEGIAQRGSDIDVVYANGYGFPRWRGGPFAYADEIGLARVTERIAEFAEQHGARWWSPAPLLEQLAASGDRLSSYSPESRSMERA